MPELSGANHVPVRVVVEQGDRVRVGVVAAQLPRVVDALENYLGTAFPWSKLDLVAVPHFFGAIEKSRLMRSMRRFSSAIPSGDRLATGSFTSRRTGSRINGLAIS